MLLTSVNVKSFRSIDNSGAVAIEPKTTVLVGINEAGKTAFMQAMYKSRPVESGIAFSITEDFPRKHMIAYEKKHATSPAEVAVFQYALESKDLKAINDDLGFELLRKLGVSITHKYDGGRTVEFNDLPEAEYVKQVIRQSPLPSDVAEKVSDAKTIAELLTKFVGMDLNEASEAFRKKLADQFGTVPKEWHSSFFKYYVWNKHISSRVPKFLYFDDYRLLPGKVNLPALVERVKAAQQNKQRLDDEDTAVTSLLRMAGVDPTEFTATTGYESVKARLEAISNSITDKVFKFWRQNSELDVEFDIRPDPKDRAPFNSGDNLYIRIKNRRHRVSVPFSQRSRGFIWFFSFIAWFDSVKQQLATNDQLILLLDEPGLSLHALAQADFLDYIDELAAQHQVIYTTHSPFMVRNDRIHETRAVEDRTLEGTTVKDDISGSDQKTIFPLQAALGYTVAQNLFIGKRNLLVEGISDLIFLQGVSAALEKVGRQGLRSDITLVPVGGLDKIATFVALLGANNLEMGVLHDFRNNPDQHLQNLSREKLIKDKNIHHFAMYRSSQKAVKGKASNYANSDVEDLFEPESYLSLFNLAYQSVLPKAIRLGDLPAGDRIVDRLERHLAAEKIAVRPSGGFNHYLPAHQLVSNGHKHDKETLDAFERMFEAVNQMFTASER